MDIQATVKALAEALAPALPFLIKGGEKAAEAAAEQLGVAAWKRAVALWDKLRGRLEGSKSASEAAEEVAKAPGDADALGALRLQLKKALKGDAALARSIVALLAEPTVQINLDIEVSGSGGAAQAGGVAGGANSRVAGRNQINVAGDQHIHHHHEVPVSTETRPRDADALRTRYLKWLLRESNRLPLGFVEASDEDVRQSYLQLRAVYTALLTETPREREEPELTQERREGEPPLSAVEVLDRAPRLVLRGGPGSGKSAFVNFVALCLAGEALGDPHANLAQLTAPLPDEDGSDQPEHQPWRQGALLPVKVVLRDFAASGLLPAGSRGGQADHLWQFIERQLSDDGHSEYVQHLKHRLEANGGLVMLDGLDEVPEEDQRRDQVREAVQAFAEDYDQCRFLVTVRSYAYEDQAWRLADFTDAELAELGPGQIRRFVDRWYAHAANLKRVTSDDAAGRAELLTQVIFERPRLRELAERPLLLTLMAHLHAERNRDLPEKRVLLYEEVLGLLLKRWEGRLLRLDSQGKPVVEQESLAEWLRVGPDRVREALEALAFDAHASQPEPRGTADIREADLRNVLVEMSNDPDCKPDRLVEHLRDRTGILGNRGRGVYTFPHRSFQEYLAACYLTGENEPYPDRVCELGRADPDRWREVVLLAGGKAAEGNAGAAWQLAEALCPGPPAEGDPALDDLWGARLAAQLLVESANLDQVQTWNVAKRDTVRAWLQGRLITDARLPARERALAGDNLAQLGDGRFDPEHWHLPAGGTLGFLEVPAGLFQMGSDAEEDNYWLSARPPHEVTLPAYYIARWPVTVAQFRAFVEMADYDSANPEALTGLPNHPVVYVTWHDAVAYCRWLDERLRALAPERLAQLAPQDAMAQRLWSALAEGTLHAGLPSEAEWEKAARADDGRIYPWGADVGSERANYRETGLGSTSAVGCFSGGESPYGCEEMSGNVWEWTRTLWGKDLANPDFRYPYVAEDGREDLDASGRMHRVLRGGAFFSYREYVRCAFRLRNDPYFGYFNFGFRVVLSPLL